MEKKILMVIFSDEILKKYKFCLVGKETSDPACKQLHFTDAVSEIHSAARENNVIENIRFFFLIFNLYKNYYY